MSPDFWTAVFSGLTLVVFVLTAIVGVIQLRHLRVANSLTGLVTILQDWQKPEMQSWVSYVRGELREHLKDPAYLEKLAKPGPILRSEHPEFHICDYYEQVGSYVKYQMIDREAYLDVSSFPIVAMWESLWPVVAAMREKRKTESLYENFEYLAVISRQFNDRYPNGTYPPNLPRWRQIRKDASSG